jgi:hypothetical protein
MIKRPNIIVAIPLMDEFEHLPALLQCLKNQTCQKFRVFMCVNQPESYHTDPGRKHICKANHLTIRMLREVQGLDMQIIDRSSEGKGWTGKHFGVGWARKVAMDAAAMQADDHALIVAMDGDTGYPADYLQSLVSAYAAHPEIKAIAVPYYHKLTGNLPEDRSVLRYEIYMRYYALNMLRINNPYAFTALGSAMACPAAAYRGVRGITPHKSGEDFYFIQKLRKFGPVLIHLDSPVYPAARFSDRVFFGTGPAMIKGDAGDWSAYPIYPFHFFDEVKKSFDGFELLFQETVDLPMSRFLYEKFGTDLWDLLRENARSKHSFTKACHYKVDGLRILQYLKWRQNSNFYNDEQNLISCLKQFYPGHPITDELDHGGFDFTNAGVNQMDRIRNFLFEKETQWRKKIKILRE